ncbi:hypothetical protein Skr01_60090 [Sphaerisporangium krabiense]|uniref:Outer membrane protein assembly factor BamB n=1 Tax=Sphaerisporangium krabiense TaxID=763782 RepID=A0A7W9DTV8_9ACTN|nr:arylsulfotransferase family protein [Sphaerisporangium krabiense]MBB5631041.1 outer membrane protein assembly factor BamB [Sphaerisporangium krabiense]GII65924.1 hypothetical protein Skr01_60090 [Sphaerisporangium krabiense]
MKIQRQKLLSTITYIPEKAFDGYTIFTPLAETPGTTWLVDMHGRIIHRWDLPGQVRLQSHLLDNGNILTGLAHRSNYPFLPFSGGEIAEIDWNGETVWSYEDKDLDLHDWVLRENGNLIVLKYTDVPDEIARRVQGGRSGGLAAEIDGKMTSYVIQEITREGDVVWEWTAYEHMDPELDAVDPTGTRSIWPGWNAIEELPNGDLMMSSYNTSTVVIVNRESGEVTWRWGKGDIAFQHNPTWLDNGHILLLDNQRVSTRWMPPDSSRVIEVDPETKKVVWEYRTENPVDFHNTYMGGAERLPNGNTLVCDAAHGRIFEVTLDGEPAWEYVVPFFGRNDSYGLSNAIFRAHRYAPDHPGLRGRDLSGSAHEHLNAEFGPGARFGEKKAVPTRAPRSANGA